MKRQMGSQPDLAPDCAPLSARLRGTIEESRERNQRLRDEARERLYRMEEQERRARFVIEAGTLAFLALATGFLVYSMAGIPA